MKKLIVILLLIFPLSLIANGERAWSKTHAYKTIGYQSKHSIHKSKQKKDHKTAKSIKRLQKKWHTFKRK